MTPALPYTSLSPAELAAELAALRSQYADLVAKGLSLDITRGVPSTAQLDLSGDLLTLPAGEYRDADGVDCRNYGGVLGLRELREIFAELLEVPAENLVAGNNSSLELMHNLIVESLLHAPVDGAAPWAADPKRKFLCPAPGYDRHFAVADDLGFELVPVRMLADGPDVDQVAELIANDPSVKGMWLVPTYSNPTGTVVSEQTIRRLLALPAAAPDFRLVLDNAYALHPIIGDSPTGRPFLAWAEEAGRPNRPLVFASTSKITLAGAGVSFFAASKANLDWHLAHAGKRSIGPDKVNQLRHVLFFRDAEGVRAHMRRHRALLAPKFALVLKILEDRLGSSKIASWTEPQGGYFVSLDVLPGTAREVVRLAKEAGVALTPAGATFPRGADPQDSNIRIAPTFLPEAKLADAIEATSTCALLAAAQKLAEGHAG
ncbi:MAG: aminotransferase class I/II-fold pyridoxal phosphate-dependent enzyme [Segniliparus sp.]|uniref:aminotransferase class I/II-fold pyridoxal phosphate-dependent enzyme n=1 Tax=Segniliparus sp. TaxID=2804064 RepID=UPI003F2D3983